MEFLVNLNRVEDVKEFVRIANIYDCDIDVCSQDRHFTVDGASIMGMFSLNLSKPVLVSIKDIEVAESFKNDISQMIIK